MHFSELIDDIFSTLTVLVNSLSKIAIFFQIKQKISFIYLKLKPLMYDVNREKILFTDNYKRAVPEMLIIASETH